jgi:predicted transcriptional regulator
VTKEFMKFIRSILTLAAFTLALPLAAQEQSGKPGAKSGTTIELSDSVDFKLSPELKKSLDELALAVQALAIRVVTDPQVRAAAIQVASGFVVTAQQVVTEQSVALQEALKTAAERIATVQSTEKRQPKKAP